MHCGNSCQEVPITLSSRWEVLREAQSEHFFTLPHSQSAKNLLQMEDSLMKVKFEGFQEDITISNLVTAFVSTFYSFGNSSNELK